MSNVLTFPVIKQKAYSKEEITDRARILFFATFTPWDVGGILKNIPEADIVRYSDYITHGDTQINEYLTRFSVPCYKAARRTATNADRYLPEDMIFEPVKREDGRWVLVMMNLDAAGKGKEFVACPFGLNRWCYQPEG